MKVYRHVPKGTRFYVQVLFLAILLALNIAILPAQEELPVKVFTLLFTLAWLAVTIDSLTARVVVDEKGIAFISVMCKKFASWKDITDVSLGHRWILGTFMPEHVIVCYKEAPGKEKCTITLHNDLNNWKDLLGDIVANTPARAVSGEVKSKAV